jgi:hypothetical protein
MRRLMVKFLRWRVDRLATRYAQIGEELFWTRDRLWEMEGGAGGR